MGGVEGEEEKGGGGGVEGGEGKRRKRGGGGELVTYMYQTTRSNYRQMDR